MDNPLLYLYGWDGRGENVHSTNLIPNIFLALLFLVKLVTTLSSLQNCFAGFGMISGSSMTLSDNLS
jgi:hypothetical protein